MTITYRETDNTRWGAGKDAKLTKGEIDTTIWTLSERIRVVEENPVLPAEISNMTMTGTQLTIFLSDARTFGPFTIPIAAWRYLGEWQPNFAYVEMDTFKVTDQGLFMVLHDHTSAATFSKTATGPEGSLYLHVLPSGFSVTSSITQLGDIPDAFTGHAGKVLVVNATEDGMDFVANPYDVGGHFPGAPTASKRVFRYLATRAVNFLVDIAGSQGHAETAATASTVFDIQKNGVSVGSMTFAAAGTVATFTAASAFALAAGDRLDIIAPATPDSTLADITWTLVGTR